MKVKRKIIFIEDDVNLATIILMSLRKKGYEVCFVNSLSCIQELIVKESPDILLLDLEVGGQNALLYLSSIRQKYPSLPIIVASSHNDGEEITRCYEAGVDHYTKKPYDIEEIDYLICKLCQEVLTHPTVVSFGDFQVKLSTHQLTYRTECITTLPQKEFKVLWQLATNINQPVSREILLQTVWQNTDAQDSLNNCISHIRKLLGKDGSISLNFNRDIGYILLHKD